MDVNMSAMDVLEEIKKLRQSGSSLNKKLIKQSHPHLMRSALHYFPSWDHAVKSIEG